MSRREIRAVAGNLALLVGTCGVGLIVLVALFGPQLSPYDPQAQRVIVFFPNGNWAIPPNAPNPWYVLGTDPIGRDILSRLLWGARVTLVTVALAVLGRAALGIALGMLAGWLRGPLDTLLRYVTAAVTGFPHLMLAICIVVLLKDLGLVGFVIALAATGWAELALFVRAEVLRLRSAAHVDAARAIGVPTLRLLRDHVARNLLPQLVGLVALEAGSALILLAELGFIGFFIGGGVFYTDEQGRPILPARERTPEWGQMLAGARNYAYTQQWVAYVPAVVVGSAVFAFNLLGEGIRQAVDPFSARRLPPRTAGVLMRGALVFAVAGLISFAALTVRQTTLTFESGLEAARAAAARELAGGELIAGVIRYDSGVHAIARPEKINYYFQRPGENAVLRVGFINADPDAMEVKHFDREDDLEWGTLRPVGAWTLASDLALASAEERGGQGFRYAGVAYRVRLVLQLQEGWGAPVWRAQYFPPASRQASLDLLLDARTGSTTIPLELFALDADPRARALLGEPVMLVAVAGEWPPGSQEGDAPSVVSYTLTSEREPGTSTALVSYGTRTGLSGQAYRIVGVAFIGGERVVRPERLSRHDLLRALALADSAGGRSERAAIVGAGGAMQISVQLYARDGRALADVSYAAVSRPGSNRTDFTLTARFRADLDTSRVERLPRVP